MKRGSRPVREPQKTVTEASIAARYRAMKSHPLVRALVCFVGGVIAASHADPDARAQSLSDAHWIWGDPAVPPIAPKTPKENQGETEKPQDEWLFTRTIALPATPTRAIAWVSCDNRFRLSINGSTAGRGDDWARLQRFELTHLLHTGDNLFVAQCRNEDGPAGFLFALEATLSDGRVQRFVSDAAWSSARPHEDGSAATVDAGAWRPAREVAPFGAAPWGELTTPPAPTFDPLPASSSRPSPRASAP